MASGSSRPPERNDEAAGDDQGSAQQDRYSRWCLKDQAVDDLPDDEERCDIEAGAYKSAVTYEVSAVDFANPSKFGFLWLDFSGMPG